VSDEQFGNYYYVKVEARCEIGGASFPVSSIEATYGMNVLPEATVGIPIGRVAGGARFNSVSSAVQFITELGPFTPVKIFATLTPSPSGRGAPAGPNSGGNGYPAGQEFLIFEGFGSVPGAHCSFGSATISLKCMGKTAAFAGSTQMVVGSVASEVPNGSSPVISFFGAKGGAAPTLFTAVLAEVGESVSDLFQDVIAPILDNAISDVESFENTSNGFARQALARLNIGDALPSADLNIDVPGTSNTLSKAILGTALRVFLDAWKSGDFNGDLWSGILALAPYFGFKYVTAIEEDAILPITFGLGGPAWRTISPSDYTVVNFGAEMDEKFYSYVTQVQLYTYSFQSSQWQNGAPAAREVGFSEIFPANLEGSGRLLMCPAPEWLIPAGAPGTTTVSPGNATPDASNPEAVALAQNQAAEEIAFMASGIGDDYAETVLYDNLFAHRSMKVAGRIRFDIAPGSLVEVVVPGERFTGQQASLFGHVVGVTISINEGEGGTGYARTNFGISHVRTAAEHAKFFVLEHPFFGDKWVGGKLSSKA
jgi:hypothetical protein